MGRILAFLSHLHPLLPPVFGPSRPLRAGAPLHGTCLARCACARRGLAVRDAFGSRRRLLALLPISGQGLAGPWHASGQGHTIGPCLQVFPHFGGGGATSWCMLGASRRLYSASRFGTRAVPSFAAGSPAHLWAGPGWVMACVWAGAALAVRGGGSVRLMPPSPCHFVRPG